MQGHTPSWCVAGEHKRCPGAFQEGHCFKQQCLESNLSVRGTRMSCPERPEVFALGTTTSSLPCNNISLQSLLSQRRSESILFAK